MQKMTAKKAMRAAMMKSNTTQTQLAKLVGAKGQSNISSAMLHDMKISRFVQYLDAMGYEVIVRERKRGRRSAEDDDAYLLVREDEA